MNHHKSTKSVRSARRRSRHGALLSMELLLILPVVMILLSALVEFSLIWSANSKIKAASRLACRVATLPSTQPLVAEYVIREKVIEVLESPKLVDACKMDCHMGQYTGDPCTVVVSVPMKAITPDLLSFVGLGLKEREIVARTVMRKE
jgi:hypothetical protein